MSQKAHWQSVMKCVKDSEGKGVAVYDIAEQLKLDKNDTELQSTIDSMEKKGKIRKAIGLSSKGVVCSLIVMVGDVKDDRGRDNERDTETD